MAAYTICGDGCRHDICDDGLQTRKYVVMAADTICGDGCRHDMWWWLQTRYVVMAADRIYAVMAADTICGDGCRHDIW